MKTCIIIKNVFLIWKNSCWYGEKQYDVIIIDGKNNYLFVDTPFMEAEDFSYSTIQNDSEAYNLYKSNTPSLVSFVANIKASSTLKDKNYSYDIENVTFPCRANCYVQNLPWAECVPVFLFSDISFSSLSSMISIVLHCVSECQGGFI